MRLEELYLDGFGHFHQRAIGPISGHITVFYGPNEAGKSTLLAFIRAVLFGFPRAYNSHYPPQGGGRHGGRAVVSDDAGSVFTVERYAGSRSGVSVATAHGPAPNADALLQRLTGNATPDLFRNVFAFSLDELQAASSLNDSSGAIYSAGQGAPGLPALVKSLSDKKGQIYLPRGNAQRVPTLINDLRKIDDQLTEISGNAGLYGDLTSRKSAIDRELLEGEGTLAELHEKQARTDRILNGWDDWVALSDCESQLKDLPRYVDFPDNPIPRLEGLEDRARQVHEDHDAATRQLQKTEKDAEAIIPDEDLLYDLERIEGMRRDRNRFDAAVRDLPERQTELREMEGDFAKTVADLGHGWGETELQSFDTSLVVRNHVDSWKGRIADTADQARQAQFQLVQERRTLLDHRAATQEAREKLPPQPPLDAAELSEQQDALRTARSRLGEYERQRQNHETLRGQLNALAIAQETPERESRRIGPLPVIAPVLAGVALAVAGILLGGGALFLGVLCGLVLLLAAAMVWFMGRSTPPVTTPSPVASAMERQTAAAEEATEAARQLLLDSAAAALGLRQQPDAAALDSAEAALILARNGLDAWSAASTRIEDAARRETLQEKRLEATVKLHEAAEESIQAAHQEWRHWLGERGLNETLTPDAMAEFLARIEAARGALLEVRRMRERVAAIEHDIQEFREWVEPLAVRHELALQPEDNRHVAVIADEIIRRLDEAQAAYSAQKRAREQVEEDRQALTIQEKRLLSVGEELAQLMAGGGTDDAEEFRRRARLQEERDVLELQHAEFRRSLERLSGPGDRFDSFRAELENADPDRLREESAQLTEIHAEVDSQRNALREERGGIDTELAQLTSEEQSSALRARRHTLFEQLQEHAREWSRLTIAEALLDKTRRKFEQERQPSVVQHAQEFFNQVTGHRYSRLFAPIGEQTITVIDSSGAQKQPHELSRGTREQLYLALRFGLIREFGQHAEHLPVVVDEALVNFDPGRARLAAEAFAQLAETNQVLVFTCHPSTAEMFTDAAGAQVVDISQ